MAAEPALRDPSLWFLHDPTLILTKMIIKIIHKSCKLSEEWIHSGVSALRHCSLLSYLDVDTKCSVSLVGTVS